MSDGKKIEFEVIDHGMNSSDGFPGIGSGDFDEVAVGIGSSPKEAFMDAAEQIFADQGKDVNYDELEKETDDYTDDLSVVYKVSFEADYTSEESDDGKVEKIIKGDGRVHTDVSLMTSAEISNNKEVGDDGGRVWITVYDNSPDSAADRVRELIEDGEYHVSRTTMKILKRISGGGEVNDMYYYVGIRYSVLESTTISYLIKKAELFGKDSSKAIHIKEPSEDEIISKTEEALKDGFEQIVVYSDDKGMPGKIKEALEDAYDDVEVAANNIGAVAVWP